MNALESSPVDCPEIEYKNYYSFLAVSAIKDLNLIALAYLIVLIALPRNN